MNLPPEEEDGDGKEAFEEEQEEEGKEQETDSPLPDFDFVPVFPCLEVLQVGGVQLLISL